MIKDLFLGVLQRWFSVEGFGLLLRKHLVFVLLVVLAKFWLSAVAIARTDLQTGFMWLVRSVAQPTTF